jgi:hypothetical protein
MRPQTISAPIALPTIISIDDGSSQGLTATDKCPDFSSAYIVKANSSSFPSQINSVEEHLSFCHFVKKQEIPKPNIIQMFKQGMARLSSNREERAESAAMIAASRLLLASGGHVDEESNLMATMMNM